MNDFFIVGVSRSTSRLNLVQATLVQATQSRINMMVVNLQ